MTKTTLDQELRSLTAAVQAKYPEPAKGQVSCPNCDRHVPWTSDDWRGYQMTMCVEPISPSQEPEAYEAMFQAFLGAMRSEHCTSIIEESPASLSCAGCGWTLYADRPHMTTAIGTHYCEHCARTEGPVRA